MFITGLLVYYPSAWLYNVSPPSLPEQQQPAEVPQITINNTDETHNFTACSSNTNNNDERVKEADDVQSSGVIIQTTWGVGREEEGVIIVNEFSIQMSNNRHVPQEEEASTMNDEIIAIEILDTILDAASEEDLREMSDAEIVMDIMESSDDNQTPERFNRDEIEAEIDAILELALAQVEKLQSERDKINIASDDEIETENVFQNQTFLSHLNDLIANKSSSPIKVSTSKTLGRKQSTTTVGKVMLKHSYSLTDLTRMLDSEANVDRSFRMKNCK